VFRDEARDPDRTIRAATFTASDRDRRVLRALDMVHEVAVGEKKVVGYAARIPPDARVSRRHLLIHGRAFTHRSSLCDQCVSLRLSFHKSAATCIPCVTEGVARPWRRSPEPPLPAERRWRRVINVVLVVAAIVTSLDPVNQFYTWLGA